MVRPKASSTPNAAVISTPRSAPRRRRGASWTESRSFFDTVEPVQPPLGLAHRRRGAEQAADRAEAGDRDNSVCAPGSLCLGHGVGQQPGDGPGAASAPIARSCRVMPLPPNAVAIPTTAITPDRVSATMNASERAWLNPSENRSR